MPKPCAALGSGERSAAAVVSQTSFSPSGSCGAPAKAGQQLRLWISDMQLDGLGKIHGRAVWSFCEDDVRASKDVCSQTHCSPTSACTTSTPPGKCHDHNPQAGDVPCHTALTHCTLRSQVCSM